MTTMPFDQLKLSDKSFANPRVTSGLDPESIRELAIHIGLHGLLNNLLVLDDGLIVAGQRRYKAIEFLLQWFTHGKVPVGPEVDALRQPFADAFGDLTHDDVSRIEATARSFEDDGIPVRVLQRGNRFGIALADNVQRSDLSTYEEADYCTYLIGQGLTQADIVRLVGKSKAWVSRRVTTFQKACPEVRDAWRTDVITFERAQEIVQLEPAEQVRALEGPVPRGIRGPVNRPGIETVKEILGDMEQRDLSERTRYVAGVLDALRWVAGEKTSADFGQLVGGNDAAS